MTTKTNLTAALAFGAVLAFGTLPAGATSLGSTPEEAAQSISNVNAWLDGDTPATEVTYDGEPFTFVVTHHLPAVAGLPKLYTKAFTALDKMTNGKIKADYKWGGTVHAVAEGRRATRSGLSHMAACYSLYTARDYNMVHGLGLPFLFENAHVATAVGEEVYGEYLRDEFERHGVLIARMQHTSPYHIYSRTTPVRNLEDLKGMKIRAGGGMHAKIIETLGAVQTNMPAADMYTALQRGLLDGAHIGDAIAPAFKVFEVTESRTTNGFNVLTVEYCLNEEFWKQLPADLQVAFNAWLRSLAQAEAQGFYSYEDVRGVTMANEAGIEIVDMDEAEMDRWRAALAPLEAEWIEEQEKAGRPGKQFIEDVKAAAAKYSAMSANDLFQTTIDAPHMNMYDFK